MSEAIVPTTAPSVRRVLVTSGVLAVILAIWAVAYSTWLPFLVLAAYAVLVGPFPWRRMFWETRFGYALAMFVWSGVMWGIADSVIFHRHGAHAVGAGLFFGVVLGIGLGIAWEPETRKSRHRVRRWLRAVASRFARPA